MAIHVLNPENCKKNVYPLDYEIFEGYKYEDETLLPVVGHFKSKYAFKELIAIADSGLLSKKSIEQLKAQQYQYILGVRIKNMNKGVTAKILNLKLQGNQYEANELTQNERLVVGYKKSKSHQIYIE